jgi:hypothetical protein
VFGDGWPDDIVVPEAEDPIPESGRESRFDGGDGDGVLDVVVCVFRVDSRAAVIGAANFFSKAEAVRAGSGSSSLTIMA